MNVKANIHCSCNCLFEVSFQNSTYNNCPVCPSCGKVMDENSWHSLRNSMAELTDYNYHSLKYADEQKEPLMLVASLTCTTFSD